MKKHLFFPAVYFLIFLTSSAMGQQCVPSLGPMNQVGMSCGDSTTATIAITGLLPKETFVLYYLITNYEHAKIFTINIASNSSGDDTVTIPVIYADSGQLFWVTELDNTTVGCTENSSVFEYNNRAELFVSRSPQIIVTPTPASICTGQSTTLVATGAYSYHGYAWSPATDLQTITDSSVIASPTITTTYIVSATSLAGCAATDTFTLTVNALPNVSVSGLNSSYCVNASPVVLSGGSPTGGAFNGTGVNDGIFYPSQAGVGGPYTITYSYTDNNNCSNAATEQVSINALPVIKFIADSIALCSGVAVNLYINGAVYYVWSPSTGLSNTTGSSVTASPVASITYEVTGTNSNGCSDTNHIPITVSPLPKISASPNPGTYCAGGNSTITASGGEVYSWTPSTDLSSVTGSSVTANPTTSTTYIVTGIDSSGCSDSSTVIITVDAYPTITVSHDTTIHSGDTAHLVSVSNSSVTWLPSTGLSCISCSNPLANPTVTTTYVATATDGICSTSDTVVVTVTPPTGTEQLTYSDPHLNIYPNPTSGQFTLRWDSKQPGCTIDVYDVMGEKVYQSIINKSQTIIDLSSQTPGLYFIYSKSGQDTQVAKIVITR